MARRAHSLQRFLPRPVPPDALLVARISAAVDRFEEAGAMIEETRALAASKHLTQFEKIMLATLDLVLAGYATSDRWDEVVDEGRKILPGEEFLEILFFRALTAAKHQHWPEVGEVVVEARQKLAEQPAWQQSFDEFVQRLPYGTSIEC